MRVLVEFGPGEDRLARGRELAQLTGMTLEGTAASINAASFDNGADTPEGSKAAATLNSLWPTWVTPGVIAHYNYGANLPLPGDFQPLSSVGKVLGAFTDKGPAGVPIWAYAAAALVTVAGVALLLLTPPKKAAT